MTLSIKKLTKSVKKKTKMYTLVNVTILSELKKLKKIHRELDDQYKELQTESWIDRTFLTIINAIITQNRKVFILTRTNLTALLKKDDNHPNKPCVNKDEYAILISALTDVLLSIDKVKRGPNYVSICTVKSKEILKHLTSDQTAQEKEVREYVTKSNFRRTTSNESIK